MIAGETEAAEIDLGGGIDRANEICREVARLSAELPLAEMMGAVAHLREDAPEDPELEGLGAVLVAITLLSKIGRLLDKAEGSRRLATADGMPRPSNPI